MKYYLPDIIFAKFLQIKANQTYIKEDAINLFYSLNDKISIKKRDEIYFLLFFNKIIVDIKNYKEDFIEFDRKSIIIVHPDKKNVFSFFGKENESYLLTTNIDILIESDYEILSKSRFRENFTLVDSNDFLEILKKGAEV